MSVIFDNTYIKLPEKFYEKILPVPVKKPKLINLNKKLSDFLNLNYKKFSGKYGELVFSGNLIPNGSNPIAMAYAGHQFGQLVPKLGDGRAILLGEIIAKDGKRYDMQLKGSGKTSFSRGGDGRAPLGPIIREFLVSESIFHLNIPTTRVLAITSSGEFVKRETLLPGGLLARIASSHIRIGTFEYFFYKKDLKSIKQLADYSINRHFPEIKKDKNIYLSFLKKIVKLQAKLVSNWMQIGFIHGVMNTDNTSICGETIDYGPCAFMDFYDPKTVFSFIDTYGRYSFINQAQIALWNLTRLAECLLGLINNNFQKSQKKVVEILNDFSNQFNDSWLNGMRKKIGLKKSHPKDISLIQDFLKILENEKIDYTSTFRNLSNASRGRKFMSNFLKNFQKKDAITSWIKDWKKRLEIEKQSYIEISNQMKKVNPNFLARNHLVEKAINNAINKNDFSFMNKLLQMIRNPFKDDKNNNKFSMPPKKNEIIKHTFCGT